jgi:uncharacterized membrane protein YqjE
MGRYSVAKQARREALKRALLRGLGYVLVAAGMVSSAALLVIALDGEPDPQRLAAAVIGIPGFVSAMVGIWLLDVTGEGEDW